MGMMAQFTKALKSKYEISFQVVSYQKRAVSSINRGNCLMFINIKVIFANNTRTLN